MKYNCLLAGVGGQGTVLASKIIAQTAIDNEMTAQTAETIGMAQRGGCVVSHVRIGRSPSSPIIPLQQADLIIGFEPGEALRSFPYLKKEGKMLVNSSPITPITASLGNMSYEVKNILDFIQKNIKQPIIIDGEKLCRQAGSAKVLNVIMLGVAVKEKLLPFSREQITATLTANLPDKFLDLNLQALNIGLDYQNS